MDTIIEMAGTAVGILYLWLEYRASIYLWIASIIMPAIYLYIYYNAGLYADFGINIYYLAIALYGWLAWRYRFSMFGGRERQKQKELEITHTPHGVWVQLFATYAVAQVAITYLLANHTDSTVPLWDSFTTSLSIVGMFMLARKYIEQWWIWLVVDATSAVLYIYKNLYFTAALYAFYAIISIFGYFKWKKMMTKQITK